MHCTQCGAFNADDAHFCTQCGAALHPEAVPLTISARLRVWFRLMPRWLPIGAAAVILLLLAALIALGVSQRKKQHPTSVVVRATSNASPAATSPPVLPSDTPSPTPSATSTSTPTPSATPSATPTPTFTPSRTPTPSATFTPTATPTPTKKPKPSCRRAKKGLIGFKRQKRCNKKTGAACGPVEIWVMNPDGSGQARMCNPKAYTWGLTRDRTSPDGTWRVEVSSQKADIIRVYDNGRWEWLIVNNRKDWDPVLSLDGWWLAWVTNRNANDEIYIKTLDPADQNQRRLTENAWEWDKHPTWSPDGRKIAFYSNRADSLGEATRQIWIMDIVNDKGVNLRNISRRPDRVDTDPVWFKWDDMPY